MTFPISHHTGCTVQGESTGGADGNFVYEKVIAVTDGMVTVSGDYPTCHSVSAVVLQPTGALAPRPSPPPTRRPPTPSPAPPAKEDRDGSSNDGGSKELVVYGRKTCGLTRAMMRQLDGAGYKYRLALIDTKEGSREMWPKLRAASITGRIGLPVVDMCGKIAIRPNMEDIEVQC